MQLIVSTEPSELMPSGCSDRVKVGGGILRKNYRGRFPKIAGAVAAMLALSACASNEYMGISLKPGAAAADLQELARRAQTGDKQAQLELGIRYEEGREVSVDLRRAKQFYALAASDDGGTIWTYSPPVGEEKRGQMLPVDIGPKQAGLVAARERLKRMNVGEHK